MKKMIRETGKYTVQNKTMVAIDKTVVVNCDGISCRYSVLKYFTALA